MANQVVRIPNLNCNVDSDCNSDQSCQKAPPIDIINSNVQLFGNGKTPTLRSETNVGSNLNKISSIYNTTPSYSGTCSNVSPDISPIYGCNDPKAINYNPKANRRKNCKYDGGNAKIISLWLEFYMGENINQSTFNLYEYNNPYGEGLYFSDINKCNYIINIQPLMLKGLLGEGDIVIALYNNHLVGYRDYIPLENSNNSMFLDVPVGGYSQDKPHYCNNGNIVTFKILRLRNYTENNNISKIKTKTKLNTIIDNKVVMARITSTTLNLLVPPFQSNEVFVVDDTSNVTGRRKIYTIKIN